MKCLNSRDVFEFAMISNKSGYTLKLLQAPYRQLEVRITEAKLCAHSYSIRT